MSNPSNESRNGAARNAAETSNSTYGEERWQGPNFAASWISPPSPRRSFDDPTAPHREDDHA